MTKPVTNPHAHRLPPKPLRAAGLHSVKDSPRSTAQYSFATPQPADRFRANQLSVRGMARPANLPIHTGTARGTYNGAELQPYVGRPSATDALALPSRVGNRLFYRDGRVEMLE